MSKRGRRVRQPRGPHKDKYAAGAATAQQQLAAFNSQWEREHPTPPTPAVTPEASGDSEDEEVA
jgi:hypothetical protein